MKALSRFKKINLGSDKAGLHFLKTFSTAADGAKPHIPTQQWHRIREGVDAANSRSRAHISHLHSTLQLCAKIKEPAEGKACHARAIVLGLESDSLLSNMIINVYSKCGFPESARKVFDKMPVRTVVSWNTLIGMYTQNDNEQEALALFLEMQREGSPFSEFTVSSVVCACAAEGDFFECKQLHAFAIKAALDSNVFVGTSLLDVYAKSGLIQDASRVFNRMPEKSVVTWTSMLAGYVQNQLYEEALLFLKKGQATGLECNQFIMSSAVSACAALAATIEGKQLQAAVFKGGFGSNNYVATSLIEMYAKCGCIKEAYAVFSEAEGKNIVLWNAMISGFAKHSCSLEVMVLFEKMQQMGLQPDEVTYGSVLSACSHMGLVDNGQEYFYLMIREHNLSPNILHYSCMVDILSRAGLLHGAYELIRTMPFRANAPMWGSLLASCRIHKNPELAQIAAENLSELEPDNAGNYVLLSNTYAASRKWEEAAKARKFIRDREMKKERGKSWIEIKNKVHEFISGQRNHPRITDIHSELENLLAEMEKLGYKAETDSDVHDAEESSKQDLLKHHSEKLALAFGLMCLPPSVPIRIMKNLRICRDCHSFMKFASIITRREIIVRDVNRFHHFSSGYCSCREFW